jgi:hypothetical protein
MSFFEEMPEPEFRVEMSRRRQPDWAGPPENVAGATVPVDLILAHTGDIAVVLGAMTAYPTGVLFDVEVLRRTFEGEDDDPFSMRFHRPRRGGFRLGVELPGGHRLTPYEGGRTDRAMLTERGGGGGGLSYATEFWLWPLPDEGTLRFACEWPDQGVEETVVGVDAGPIRAAAALAVELWPDDRPVGNVDDDDGDW